MYGYIYKTTNLYNGKIYVGQHRAKKFNPNYYGSGVRFTNVLKKYGKESFSCEMLQECSCEEELNLMEQYWIKKLNSMDREVGYNLMSGGYKVRGIKHSKETIEKISKNRKGVIPNREYTTPSEEVRTKISNTLKEYYKTHDNPKKGTHLSENTKEKLRRANLGKVYPEEVRAKHRGKTAWNKGIPMTEEAKKHLSEINKGKKSNMGKEARERHSKRWSGKDNPSFGGLTEERKEKLRKHFSGRIWVTNGANDKQIKPEELELYKKDGYIKGRTLKKK